MPEEMGFAIRRGRGFLSLNVSFDELRKLPSSIIRWLPGTVFSGLREPGCDSLRSALAETPPQLTRNPSLLIFKIDQFFETVVTYNGVKIFDVLTKIFKESQKIYF
jgi:hypothetical protein